MGFASWVCRITVNRFVFVSKICHLKVALVSGESNVYFFQTVRSALNHETHYIILSFNENKEKLIFVW